MPQGRSAVRPTNGLYLLRLTNTLVIASTNPVSESEESKSLKSFFSRNRRDLDLANEETTINCLPFCYLIHSLRTRTRLSIFSVN